ncbi:MAG: DUF2490 domain-containing protein [Flavobacterium sp.]
MKPLKIIAILFFTTTGFISVCGQNNRISTHHTIGWYNYFGTLKINEKFGIHTEYQWRREELITNWQQSLLRFGVNYELKPGIRFRLGYAWIETFPYGEIPINALGRDFTEHRIFQMIQLNNNKGSLNFFHRFMLEQRFLGRYSSPAVLEEDDFPLLNRFRYMFRMDIPLKGNTITNKTPYLALYDEIFVGYGRNVGVNIFDQNRLGLLIGYQFNSKLRIEGGYLNQILQLARTIDGNAVFQYNHGVIINTHFNFDLSTKKSD